MRATGHSQVASEVESYHGESRKQAEMQAFLPRGRRARPCARSGPGSPLVAALLSVPQWADRAGAQTGSHITNSLCDSGQATQPVCASVSPSAN